MLLAPTAHAQPVRLVVLGDSLTQGYGLPANAGFVPQLQAWLRQQGLDVLVVNAGVSGDTTAGGLARMDWTLDEPVDAMLVILGGNDLLRGINPQVSRQNLSGILSRLKQEAIPAMLVAMPVPGNYGLVFKRDFERMYVDLAKQYRIALYPDFLAPMTALAQQGQSFSHLMQDDLIHPNAQGVALMVQTMGPAVLMFLRKAVPGVD